MRDLSTIQNYDTIRNANNYRVICQIGFLMRDEYVYFGEEALYSVKTDIELFSNAPAVGNCISQRLEFEIIEPKDKNGDIYNIPKMCALKLQVALVDKDSSLKSGWIDKGFFYIDTRERADNPYSDSVLHIVAFDKMMLSEIDYNSKLEYGESAETTILDVIKEIASSQFMGLANSTSTYGIDSRTIEFFSDEDLPYYTPKYPANYSCRDVLGIIASIYCGNWVINDDGELRFIHLADKLPETRYLLTDHGDVLIFGIDEESGEDVRILV